MIRISFSEAIRYRGRSISQSFWETRQSNTSIYGYSFGGHGNRSSNYQQAKRELLDDKYNLKQHPLYDQLGESTGKFYDHGEARNMLIFEKGKEYKLAGRKIYVGGQEFSGCGKSDFAV